MHPGGDYDTPTQQQGFVHDRGDDAVPADAKQVPAKPVPRLTLKQHNPPNLIAAHLAAWGAVKPPVNTSPKASFRFDDLPLLDSKIHELLYEIRKDGRIFWMGVVVPKDTTDFTRAHVYFHPVSSPKGQPPIAKEEDYPSFTGGWSGHMQLFMNVFGAQLAGAGAKVPLLMPFSTMAAIHLTDSSIPSANMFATIPLDTVEAVLQAARQEITKSPRKPALTGLALLSFSSGIHAMRLFISAFKTTGLVKEVVDFDGPFITAIGPNMTFSPGAVSRVYTQTQRNPPPPGWVNLQIEHFENVKFDPLKKAQTPPDKLHQRIGKMMFHQALTFSTIK